jgi:hypothetical protein
MLSLLHSDSTGEMKISGTRAQLRELARRLRSDGDGRITLYSVSDPSPYSRSLETIEFCRRSGKVCISLVHDKSSLILKGDTESLDVFADNIDEFASEADFGTHLHIEHYPGHYYLEEGSESLVIAIADDPRRADQ